MNNKTIVRLSGGAAAVAVLVCTGVVAADAVADADRTSPTRYWTPADSPEAVGSDTPEPPDAVPPHPLAAKLLPFTAAWRPGPDLDGKGNDFFQTGDQAVEQLKEKRKGLSTTRREERDRQLAELKLKGVASRTYTDGQGLGSVVETHVTQADPKALARLAEIVRERLEATGEKGRTAPTVEGWPEAKCAVSSLPSENDTKIDVVECVAVESEHLVYLRAFGGTYWHPARSVPLFKDQLNHLKSPGESA
ncbi:hypothetical protein [Streptomyces sp. NPDC048603]|uniref:hypothetical protein n=1 Tax=Streptomyces sp. NPDC048603 TaxID=3365577 RepID=UPI00371BF715